MYQKKMDLCPYSLYTLCFVLCTRVEVMDQSSKASLWHGCPTLASSPSSQEKALRCSLETKRDVAAAGKIGKILAERLLLKNIPAVYVHLKREQKYHGMVVPPPVRAPRIINFLKPYVLKMHFTNKYVSAQVIHTPTATVASFASSQEKALRCSLETKRDVAAAGKIGKILAERLLLKNIPAVSVHLKREQKYHGKVKALIDSIREAGVKLL
ncbi:hypothetical protein RIF29_23923 [Crotalaria pallida]|uniref:Ribosomal protein L18 n=1 Tax=Crotalaria pallida TaxID=3830 RepID=A0AAN9EL06_CROPI